MTTEEPISPTSERWHEGTAEAYKSYSITNHESVICSIAGYLEQHAKGKVVVDLGAADASIGSLLKDKAAEIINVDPFPPAKTLLDVVPMDGVAYLKTRPDNSVDLVYAAMAVHLMDQDSLRTEVRRVLKPGGHLVCFSVSDKIPLIPDEEFFRLFVSVGFEVNGGGQAGSRAPSTNIVVKRPLTSDFFRKFITRRTWSNLVIMSDSTIARLDSLVPPTLEFVTIGFDVYDYELAPDGELVLTTAPSAEPAAGK